MKFVIVGVAVFAAIAIPAFAASEPKQSSGEPQLRQKPAVEAPKVRAAGCRTARCFNKKLTALKRQVAVLRREIFQCEQLVDVTQYDGYLFDDGAGGSFPTTAMDFTEEGDTAHERVVVYVC